MTWVLGPINLAPSKTLDAWMVLQVPFDGTDEPWTRHLIGFRREGCKAQVSSPIEMFDPVTRRALTRSAQVYELGVGPGINGDAFAVWGNWKHRNGIAHERDVTDEVVEMLVAAGHEV